MRTYLIILFAWLLLSNAKAQSIGASPSYQLIVGKSQYGNGLMTTKSYYLLTLLQQLPTLRKAITEDVQLKQVLDKKLATLKTCGNDLACTSAAMKFSESEIAIVAERLDALYQKENIFGKLITNHIIPSGCYGIYPDLLAKQLLAKAWEQDARAINHTISVYVEGKKPNYPKIDSISFSPGNREFAELVATSATLNTANPNQLFFEPSLAFAQAALELNGRAEATDYEPLTNGVNKTALEKLKKTNFASYKYSVILIPGAGPEDTGTEISAGSMIRCRIAAIQYKNGMAPFIVVSGGRVHPYKTKYSEAYEMKKFMVNTLHIPENAIIMEPHARHTTTNFRNCSRLIFRYGMPMDKPAIVSTTKSTLVYITKTLLERCKKELGYYPYQNGKILSDTEAEFYPSALSLQIDFDEPLDP